VKSGFYPEGTADRILNLLRRFDAIVCVGNFQYDLAKEMLGQGNAAKEPSLYKVHSSIRSDRINEYSDINPALFSEKLLFIGNGPSGWRSYYKGIDLLLDALQIVMTQRPGVTLTVVGEWESEHINRLMSSRPELEGLVDFVGKVSELRPFLESASLYVHPARGEAFGISIIEAMCAGVPCIVSDQTGAKEAVGRVDEQFVIPVDTEKTAKQIFRYFEMTTDERMAISKQSREIAREYTEERAIADFQRAIQEILVKE
jgi:glycosyltransferase involved in cell wall biosynthesis